MPTLTQAFLWSRQTAESCGTQRGVQPCAWMHSLLHPLNFLPFSWPSTRCFLPDQLTFASITSIPSGHWHSKLKQWLQTFRLCPALTFPLTFHPPCNFTPHAPNLAGVCISLISSLPIWIPTLTSSPQLLTCHQHRPSASRLWGCKLKYVEGLDPEHKCVNWAGERQQEGVGFVGHERTCVLLQRHSLSDVQTLW